MNSMYFSEEQVKAGELAEFLNVLLKQSYGKGDSYNEIHIKPVGDQSFTVEWICVPWSGNYGGHFEFVNDDQLVMIEKFFPDNHSELCYDEEDYKNKLDTFLKDNPGWVKTDYGTWTNEIENAKFQDELKKATIKLSDVIDIDEDDEKDE